MIGRDRCDPNYTSVAKMAKRFLPRAAAMDGAHDRLREFVRDYPGTAARED